MTRLHPWQVIVATACCSAVAFLFFGWMMNFTPKKLSVLGICVIIDSLCVIAWMT